MVGNTNEVGMLVSLLLFASSSPAALSSCLCTRRAEKPGISRHSSYFNCAEYGIELFFKNAFRCSSLQISLARHFSASPMLYNKNSILIPFFQCSECCWMDGLISEVLPSSTEFLYFVLWRLWPTYELWCWIIIWLRFNRGAPPAWNAAVCWCIPYFLSSFISPTRTRLFKNTPCCRGNLWITESALWGETWL